MMEIRILLITLLVFTFDPSANAQDFINGDLEGPSPASLAVVAPNWQKVPSTDPVCLATEGSLGDTPDLTDITGPSAFTGIVGNPYSGATFMSGIRSDDGADHPVFQEGIMQNVTGLVPGTTYTIMLHQSVVKSYGCVDTSGSWAVYRDNTLLGITDPTTSLVPYDSWPFIWEERTIPFTASSSQHVIKFLPVDDDLELNVLDPNGALRMGIDMIGLLQGHHQTGIEDDGMTTDRILSPNPFRDHLALVTGQRSTKGQIFVYTTTGVLVFGNTLTNTYSKALIDLSAITPGSYVVRIVLDGKESRHLVLKE